MQRSKWRLPTTCQKRAYKRRRSLFHCCVLATLAPKSRSRPSKTLGPECFHRRPPPPPCEGQTIMSLPIAACAHFCMISLLCSHAPDVKPTGDCFSSFATELLSCKVARSVLCLVGLRAWPIVTGGLMAEIESEQKAELVSVVAPPARQSMHAILRLRRCDPADVIVLLTPQKAKPFRSCSKPCSLTFASCWTPMARAAVSADSWAKKREWQWRPRLHHVSRRSLHGVRPHRHQRTATASVWEQNPLPRWMRVDASRKLRLPSGLNVQHRRPARLGILSPSVPKHLVEIQEANVVGPELVESLHERSTRISP